MGENKMRPLALSRSTFHCFVRVCTLQDPSEQLRLPGGQNLTRLHAKRVYNDPFLGQKPSRVIMMHASPTSRTVYQDHAPPSCMSCLCAI